MKSKFVKEGSTKLKTGNWHKFYYCGNCEASTLRDRFLYDDAVCPTCGSIGKFNFGIRRWVYEKWNWWTAFRVGFAVYNDGEINGHWEYKEMGDENEK